MTQVLRALAFDFDGVLADSVDIKTRAFCAMYEDDGPSVQRRVKEHHEFHGGMDRFRKFPVYEDFAGRVASEERVSELCKEFSRRVMDGVISAPEIPGARKTLLEIGERLPLYVVSGIPEGELREIVGARGWGQFFAKAFGAPRSKAENIGRVAMDARVRVTDVLMVGDSITDYEGAAVAGAGFIGLSNHPEVAFPGRKLEVVSTHQELRKTIQRLFDA